MTDDQAIISLTDAAVEHIQSIVKQKAGGIGFRLSIKQTGCSGYMYVPDVVEEANPDDIELQTAQGLRVFLDPQCVDLIKGTEIDFVSKELGMKQLQFNNPNAQSLCGCGESFNLKEDDA